MINKILNRIRRLFGWPEVIHISIKTTPIRARKRKLKATWTFEAAKNVTVIQSPDMEKEFHLMMLKEVKELFIEKFKNVTDEDEFLEQISELAAYHIYPRILMADEIKAAHPIWHEKYRLLIRGES